MVLNDYTSLFQVEKKLRRIDNITIPEVSYRAAAWGGVTAVLSTIMWFIMLGPLLSFFNIGGLFTFILPIAFIAGSATIMGKVATSKMRYGKELSQLAASWFKYRTRPRTLINFYAWSKTRPETVIVEAVVNVS